MSYFMSVLARGCEKLVFCHAVWVQGCQKLVFFVVIFAIPGVKSSYFVVLFGFGDVNRSHLVVFFGIAGARIYLVISILDGYSRIEVESVTKYLRKNASYIFSYLHFGRL
jgi:hypothetical protein